MSNKPNPFDDELNQQFDQALKKLDDEKNSIDQNAKKRSHHSTEEEVWKQQHPDNETVEVNTIRFSDYEDHPDPGTPPNRQRAKPKKKKSRKKRNILIIVIVIVVILLGATLFVLNKLNMIGSDGNGFGSSWIKDNDIDASDIDSIMDADSLNAWLKAWATNGGDKMHSKYVKNVLLIGVDSKSKLSDSMILMSVNERTRQIHLVSFYRDSYTYMKKNAMSPGHFAKLNAAYGAGGAKCLVNTLENDYKIDIDDYALVNYSTFPKIIDSLGGITVNVTQKEANYLNRTWHKWSLTGKKIQFHSGKMHMDGEHALMFCRIRKLDSDVGRTARQRRVIVALMNRFKNASLGQINRTLNVLLPNIKTDMSKSAIMKYVTESMTNGWTSYKVSQLTMPTPKSCVEGNAGGQWIWIVDYELAANQLQKTLYGQSNIKLAPNRVSPLSFGRKAGGVNGSANRLPQGVTSYGNESYIYYETTNSSSWQSSGGYTRSSYGGQQYEPQTTAGAVESGGGAEEGANRAMDTYGGN